MRASCSAGALTTPKSGTVRFVPLAPDVASALAPSPRASAGRATTTSCSSARLARIWTTVRYDTALRHAGLAALRFHDLRHTFGTRMIANADIGRVQEWMGHSDIQATMKYLHYALRAEDVWGRTGTLATGLAPRIRSPP